MQAEQIHFANGSKGWKVPDGPKMEPRPGPTLEIEVAAAETEDSVSSPVRDRRTAATEKMKR